MATCSQYRPVRDGIDRFSSARVGTDQFGLNVVGID
jgi:hypothetical protein